MSTSGQEEDDAFLNESSGDEDFGESLEEEFAATGDPAPPATSAAPPAFGGDDDEFELDNGAGDSVLGLDDMDDEDGVFEPKVSVRDWIHLHNKPVAIACGVFALILVLLVIAGAVVGLSVGLTSGGSDKTKHDTGDASSAFEDEGDDMVFLYDTWPNFRGGMGHSGFSLLNTTSPSNKKWTQHLVTYDPDTQALELGEPALHPSGLFILPFQVQGSSAKIIAVNVHSGGEPWHYTSHDAFLSDVQVNPDGFIVASSNAKSDTTSSRIVALSPDGDVVLEYATDAGRVIVSSVVALADDLIFITQAAGQTDDSYTLVQVGMDGSAANTHPFTCQLGRMFVDPGDEQRGFYDSGYNPTYGAPITLSESGKHIYISCGGLTDARVLAFKTSDLSPHAEYRLPTGANGDRMLSMPTISGDTLFVMEETAGVLFAFDVSSHELLYSPVVLRDALGSIVYSSTAFIVADQVNEDHVIFRGRSSDDSSYLASVDAKHGVGRWSIHVKTSSWWQAPIVVDDATSSVFLPVDDRIFRIDASSGMQVGGASVPLGSSSMLASQVGVYVAEEFSVPGQLTLHALRREEF